MSLFDSMRRNHEVRDEMCSRASLRPVSAKHFSGQESSLRTNRVEADTQRFQPVFELCPVEKKRRYLGEDYFADDEIRFSSRGHQYIHPIPGISFSFENAP